MLSELKVNHEGDSVVFSGPEGGKIAMIRAEDAIKLAHAILDQAEKALRGSLIEYE